MAKKQAPKSTSKSSRREVAEPVVPKARGKQDRLDDLTRDWERLRRQKAQRNGGVEGRVLLNLAFVAGDHYFDYQDRKLVQLADRSDRNKLNLTFDMINPRMNKLLGRLSAIDPPYRAQPDKDSPKAREEAEIVDKVIAGLDQILNQPALTWETWWWMAVAGTAIEHTPWVPNAATRLNPQFDDAGELLYRAIDSDEILPESQLQLLVQVGAAVQEQFEIYEEVEQVGEVGAEILSPLQVFVDQSVKSIATLSPDQRVYVAKFRTTGWIEDTFGKKVEPSDHLSIVSSQFSVNDDSYAGGFLRDLIPLIQGSVNADDPPMALVIDAYTPASKQNPHGRWEVFIPGQEIVMSDVSPYDGVPLTDFHWKPVTTNFWTPGYVEGLIPPQRFINKRFSQLGEQSNATLYSNVLLAPGVSPDDIPADTPGTIKNGLSESGVPQVARMGPPELPSWFLPSLQYVQQVFNDIAGGADLMQESKFPGQLRGPMAVPMIQEILDTEWGPLYNHFGERSARVKQERLNRVKEFYPPVRTMHFVNRTEKDEVLVFHKEKILSGGTNFNITVQRSELVPELRALRESRVKDRLSGPLAVLYMDPRTGALDKGKIAADLHMGDEGRASREAQYRKLGAQIVEMLWTAKPAPPVLPFYDHAAMMDELEAAMATTEFLRASPPIQQAFTKQWEAHRVYLEAEAQAQQQAMQSGMIQSAVAQATQQAAAMAAAEAVEAARGQMEAQRGQPTDELVRSAAERAQAAQGQQQPPPQRGGPPPQAR